MDTYFAAKEANEVASILLDKAESWQNAMISNGLREKLQDMWRAYHGAHYTNFGDSHQVTFAGEQGELTQLPVNHFRNFARHILTMTTSTRPSLNARAINTDYKSQIQTILANNILDYYIREKKLEVYLERAVEYAIVFGTGYVKMEWDATQGETYDVLETENGEKVALKDGDIIFSNLPPFDVLLDSIKEDDNLDWIVTRSWKNKFDFAAKYPEFKEKIIDLKTKSDIENMRFGLNFLYEETDDVAVYEFYHKKTNALPNGRYILFLDNDIILQDRAMPYRVLPVFKITAGSILGTPYGYTNMFDILPLQEAYNTLGSTVLTNQSTFGVQNVWSKTGNNININQLTGGVNLIQSQEKPEAINLTQTPAEIFKMMDIVERLMEVISAVNSVARGDPQASLKSGAALALVQSMALQFNSGLQKSYVQLMEDVGTALIKMLQDFAMSNRFIAIVGKNNRTEMKQFKGADIANINRVVVDVANPLSKTHAGRVQMADNLLQYMPDRLNPAQYVSIINTGNLDVLTEDVQNQLLLVKAENEKIMNAEPVIAMITDDHKQHILGHRSVLDDPDLRMDAQLVKRTTDHMQEHINLLKTSPPELLMMTNQQPLPPTPPQQPGNTGEVMQPAPQGIEGLQQQGAELTGPGLEQPVNLPNMPQVSADVLPNPQLQVEAMGNVK